MNLTQCCEKLGTWLSKALNRCLYSVVIVVGASLYASPAAAQNTIHVPADQPTIQAGINAAQNGDTVLVAPGTYNENIDFKGKGITVTSAATNYSGAVATVITASAYGSVVSLVTNEPSTAVLNGFTIQGASGPNANAPIAGIAIIGSSPTITNNVVQLNIGCGIAVSQGASPVIQGNDIRLNRAALTAQEPPGYCGGVAGTGLFINEAGTVTVTGNTIEENTVIGAFTTIDGTNGPGIAAFSTRKVVLMNNIVRNNIGYDGRGLDYGITDTGPDTLIMVQNLFYTDSSAPANAGSVVYIGGAFQPPFPTVVEINNSIYSNEGLQGTYAAGSIIDNNITDQVNTTLDGGIECTGGAGTAPITINNNDLGLPTIPNPDVCSLGAGNISLDPQFVDPSTGNFQVQRTSPVIAAGDITAPMIPATDLAGRSAAPSIWASTKFIPSQPPSLPPPTTPP
jgi:parallel beta-helix repeat protein/putative cofactor-binding repeat protein